MASKMLRKKRKRSQIEINNRLLLTFKVMSTTTGQGPWFGSDDLQIL